MTSKIDLIRKSLRPLIENNFGLRPKAELLQQKQPNGAVRLLGLGGRAFSDGTVWIHPVIHIKHEAVCDFYRELTSGEDTSPIKKRSCPGLSIGLGYLTPLAELKDYEFGEQPFEVVSGMLIHDLIEYAIPFWNQTSTVEGAINIAKRPPKGLYGEDRFLPAALAALEDFQAALDAADVFFARKCINGRIDRGYEYFLSKIKEKSTKGK